MRRDLFFFNTFILVALTVSILRLLHVEFSPVPGVIVFGLGIVACAFLLGTAAELSQLEISESLALVVVALLAVLPEYAVDLYFAWRAGDDPSYGSYALANMTGANRLLIGLGWPLLAFLWWRKSRQTSIALEPVSAGSLFFLAIATVYSFVIPFKRQIDLVDCAILFAIFGFYLRFAKAQPTEEIHLVGPAETIARFRSRARRWITLLLFLIAGGGIFSSSEPFAENLIACGTLLGIDEYYLVQWLAPLASESPEFLVAALLVWKLRPTAGFGTLLSSKLNQWTLLVGAIPLVYVASRLAHGNSFQALHIDERQFGELLLTASQSFAAVCVLLNRNFSLAEAAWIALLFVAQLVISIVLEQVHPPDLEAWMLREKVVFSLLYLLGGGAYLIAYRKHVTATFRIATLKTRAAAAPADQERRPQG